MLGKWENWVVSYVLANSFKQIMVNELVCVTPWSANEDFNYGESIDWQFSQCEWYGIIMNCLFSLHDVLWIILE